MTQIVQREWLALAKDHNHYVLKKPKGGPAKIPPVTGQQEIIQAGRAREQKFGSAEKITQLVLQRMGQPVTPAERRDVELFSQDLYDRISGVIVAKILRGASTDTVTPAVAVRLTGKEEADINTEIEMMVHRLNRGRLLSLRESQPLPSPLGHPDARSIGPVHRAPVLHSPAPVQFSRTVPRSIPVAERDRRLTSPRNAPQMRPETRSAAFVINGAANAPPSAVVGQRDRYFRTEYDCVASITDLAIAALGRTPSEKDLATINVMACKILDGIFEITNLEDINSERFSDGIGLTKSEEDVFDKIFQDCMNSLRQNPPS